MDPVLTDATRPTFDAVLTGTVLRPDQGGYDQARRTSIDCRPALIDRSSTRARAATSVDPQLSEGPGSPGPGSAEARKCAYETALVEAAASALATAAALPMTTTGEETLTLVWELARIARHLGELSAATRDRWAAWDTVTPHLQKAEALASDITRCLSHAAGIYSFNTTRPTSSAQI